MKNRQGFVSNSSSSSFILDTSEYEDTFDIARQMIEMREWDQDGATLRKLKELAKGLPFDTPLSFYTCNYDTFITRIGPYYFVSTCNNHPFHELFVGSLYAEELMVDDLPEEIQESVKQAEKESGCLIQSGYDFERYLKFFTPRIFVEWGVKATLAQEDYCKTHHISRLKLEDGRVICPPCESFAELIPTTDERINGAMARLRYWVEPGDKMSDYAWDKIREELKGMYKLGKGETK